MPRGLRVLRMSVTAVCEGGYRRGGCLTALALIVTVGLGFLPASLGAQTPAAGRVFHVAYLSMAPGPSPRSQALQQALRDLGYVEGGNILVEYRWADGKLDLARKAAAQLVQSNVDVIVTGGPQATRVAREATATIPIVMAVDYDPVGAGFVATLARPGGNITGLSAINPELSGKRLELLKESIPSFSRLAVLWNPAEPNAESFIRDTERAARLLGIQVQSLRVQAPNDLEKAIRAARDEHAHALAVLTDPVTLYRREELVALAMRQRLPAIYTEKAFVEAGGLMSYGADDRELHRRAAVFVDKILKGAKPADLPVEQPTKFELVINLKAAKALGLTIPPIVLARADEIVEQ